MTDASRRRFLTTTGAGAAALGVASMVPTGSAGAAERPARPDRAPAHARGTLVAHVPDVQGDTVTLMVGETEVELHDRDLVGRLARAAFTHQTREA